MVIFHDGLKIDLNGKTVGTIGRRDVDNPLGACMAYYSLKMRDKFPKIVEKNSFEDHVLGRRAILLGDALILKDCLMKYRIGSGVSSVLHYRRTPELRSAIGRMARLESSMTKASIRSQLTPPSRRESRATRRTELRRTAPSRKITFIPPSGRVKTLYR